MISQKKGLKLSRHNSQAKVPLETPKELDDSLDDFVDKQSLRVLRYPWCPTIITTHMTLI